MGWAMGRLIGMVGVMGAGGKVRGWATIAVAGAVAGWGAGAGTVGIHAAFACCCVRAFFQPGCRPHWSGRTMSAPLGLPPMVLNLVAVG